MPSDTPPAGEEATADQQVELLAVLERLNQVSAAINENWGQDSAGAGGLWRQLAESAAHLVPGASAAFYGYDAARQVFAAAPYAAAAAPGGVPAGDLRPDGLALAAVRLGRPVLAGAASGQEQAAAEAASGQRVAGAFPLRAAGDTLGILCVALPKARGLTPLETSLLENLSGQAAAVARRLAEAACEQRVAGETLAAMGELAENLLHHINNKVGIIPVRVEGIQDKCADLLGANPYLAANLEQIGRSASEALAALAASLSILRPADGGMVSPDVCVAQAIAAARLPAGVAVRVADLAALPPVYAGPESLGLVIANLLQDAVTGPGASATVVVSGAAGDGFAELTIQASGPALPARGQDRAALARSGLSAQAATAAAPGPAAGLWWAKMALARLGGSLSLQQGDQDGRTFRLRLPTVEDRHGGG